MRSKALKVHVCLVITLLDHRFWTSYVSWSFQLAYINSSLLHFLFFIALHLSFFIQNQCRENLCLFLFFPNNNSMSTNVFPSPPPSSSENTVISEMRRPPKTKPKQCISRSRTPKHHYMSPSRAFFQNQPGSKPRSKTLIASCISF
jgi:hypothetical protein